MGKIGTIVTFVAFAFGAYLTSLDPEVVNWTYFLPVVAVGAVGVFLVRREHHVSARDQSKLADSKERLTTSLANLQKTLSELDGRKENIPTYDMRYEIDRLLRDDLFEFAEHRNAMKQLFGLQAYADIMSSFAAGERYINRVWSASTDGYIDEVLAYVSKARNQFDHAAEEFKKADQR